MNSASVAPLSTALGQSNLCAARGICGSSPLIASASKPSGTLIQNSHGHEPIPKIRPPIDGPAALAVETIRL